VRFVTAASLFDGHDASINIMRRILQSQGAEVIHLGHNRSVDEIVTAAIQEDAHGVAISSYQGGHVEFFEYLVDLLRRRGAGDVRVYGGGGGVIVAEEVERLHQYGVSRIFTPEDGQRLGLAHMVNTMIAECDPARDRTSGAERSRPGARLERDPAHDPAPITLPADWSDAVLAGDELALARAISAVEAGVLTESPAPQETVQVLGITGTGGSGKSSLTDELVRRFQLDQGGKLRIAVIAIGPTRSKGGGPCSATGSG
jgi:methylmalonyl-CoA mutase